MTNIRESEGKGKSETLAAWADARFKTLINIYGWRREREESLESTPSLRRGNGDKIGEAKRLW